jgi:uncharacterized protein YgbK (DUF1537 family)
MMNCSNLESDLVPLETVRAGVHAIHTAMTHRAERIDVLVCDAETEGDLAALAQASLDIGVDPVWAGSAGLIGPLLDAAEVSRQRPALPQLVSCAGPLLSVVGTLSPVSRRQAELLAAEDVVALTTEGMTLGSDAVYSSDLADRFAAALAAGKDVLVLSTPEAVSSRPDAGALCAALRDLIAPHAGRIGGLFVTGGETLARCLLPWE